LPFDLGHVDCGNNVSALDVALGYDR
jgi:hypothetical protein